MNSAEENKAYSAADIQRYLQGEMPPAEMHAMEKAALEDPFLAEAIEGMQLGLDTHGPATINKELVDLKQQLSRKFSDPGTSAPVHSMRWWKVAAAAVIIVLAGTLAYNSWIASPGENSLAQLNKKKSEKQDITPAPTIDTNQSNPVSPLSISSGSENATTRVEEPNLLSNRKEDNTGASASRRSRKPDGHVAAADSNTNWPASDIAASNTRVASVQRSAPAEKKAGEDNPKASVEKPASTELIIVKADDKDNQKSDSFSGVGQFGVIKGKKVDDAGNKMYNFQGQVVDINNRPISNALVLTNNKKQSVVTDQSGQFKFFSPDTSLDVHISGTGFETKKFRLSNNITINKLQLRPIAGELSETIASAKAANTRSNSSISNQQNNKNIEPEKGWNAFEQYLFDNKKSLPNEVKGDVILSFYIDRKGSISFLTVESSLSPDQDEEALRLIREGPAWHVIKGKEGHARIAIHF